MRTDERLRERLKFLIEVERQATDTGYGSSEIRVTMTVAEARSILVALGGAAPAPQEAEPPPRQSLRDAARWVLNVVNGVGKAGGEPEDGEAEAASETARATAATRAAAVAARAVMAIRPLRFIPIIDRVDAWLRREW